MSDLVKKESQNVTVSKVEMGIENGGVPSNFYSKSPCVVGYSYIRFEVTGDILPCCVAKHDIGNAYKQDWRDIWHSGAYESFRKKMARINIDHFHLTDPEWSFCQQCPHLPINQEKGDLLKIKRDED